MARRFRTAADALEAVETYLQQNERKHMARITTVATAADTAPRVHWTRKPENRRRLLRVLRKAAKARQAQRRA